jgi:hypothetical protein
MSANRPVRRLMLACFCRMPADSIPHSAPLAGACRSRCHHVQGLSIGRGVPAVARRTRRPSLRASQATPHPDRFAYLPCQTLLVHSSTVQCLPHTAAENPQRRSVFPQVCTIVSPARATAQYIGWRAGAACGAERPRTCRTPGLAAVGVAGSVEGPAPAGGPGRPLGRAASW